jgi:hypothetical protein
VLTRGIVTDDVNPKLAENPKGLQELGNFACAISCFLDVDSGSSLQRHRSQRLCVPRLRHSKPPWSAPQRTWCDASSLLQPLDAIVGDGRLALMVDPRSLAAERCQRACRAMRCA